MTITTRTIEYDAGGVLMEGVFAFEDGAAAPRPGIIVSHAWGGQGEFEVEKAKLFAGQGYVALALDVYGKGRRGNSMEENEKLMNEALADRSVLQARMASALETLRTQPECDESRTAAIGFCFGGLCVLDLARSGSDVDAVISVHGLFNRPDNITDPEITAKVLSMHGWNDPMARPDDVLGFAEEMTKAGADWQLHAFGNTFHAFTNPAANVPGTLEYSPDADRRTWQVVTDFLREVLG